MINNKMKEQLNNMLTESSKEVKSASADEVAQFIIKMYGELNKLQVMSVELGTPNALQLSKKLKGVKNGILKYAHMIDGEEKRKENVHEDFSVDVDDMKDRKVEKEVESVIKDKKKEVRLTNKINENKIVEKLTVGELKKRKLL